MSMIDGENQKDLGRALFQKSSILWDSIVNGDPQVLADLIAQENQKTGEQNLLSDALFSGFYDNCGGYQISHLLDRILLIAKHFVSRVNEYDHGGYTPLMRAVQWGHLGVIQNLLSRVPNDVDIDASAKDDPTVTAAELAMTLTCTPQWNQLNQLVIEKCEWHALIYRPQVTLFIQELDHKQFVAWGSIGGIILSFLFQNHEYKCKTASEKAAKLALRGPRHASPCQPLVTRINIASIV